MANSEQSWREKENTITEDPRFDAGIQLRMEGDYEHSLEFFQEILILHEEDTETVPTPLWLGKLFFQYGTTLLCSADKEIDATESGTNDDEAENSNAKKGASSSSMQDSAEQDSDAPRKRQRLDHADNSATSIADQNDTSKRGSDSSNDFTPDGEALVDDVSTSDISESDESDYALAWQYLDAAREIYQRRLETSSTDDSDDAKEQCRDLARIISRIGDLNMTTSNYADAIIEYEQVLRLREKMQDSSVQGVCFLADTNMQIAFAYLEHTEHRGDEEFCVINVDGTRMKIADASEAESQMLGYRDRAKSLVEGLLHNLAKESKPLSKEDKEIICVTYQFIGDFKDRCDAKLSTHETRNPDCD